jgi:hypothetical protein
MVQINMKYLEGYKRGKFPGNSKVNNLRLSLRAKSFLINSKLEEKVVI